MPTLRTFYQAQTLGVKWANAPKLRDKLVAFKINHLTSFRRKES